jgi:hypothetical protein
MTDPNGARQARRRAQHERQTVIFGVIFAVLAVTLLVGAAVFTDTVRVPFLSRPFSTPKSPEPPVVPCPADGALPVNPAEVTVNVFNTTSFGGLAQTQAEALTELGFTVGPTGNKSRVETTSIMFGPDSIAQAYTLLAYVPGAELQYDSTHTDPSVDLVLGSDVAEVNTEVVVDPNALLDPSPGCVPADLISK